MTFNDLKQLALMTVQRPDRAMQALRGLNLSLAERWMALALAVALSTLLAGSLGMSGGPSQDPLLALVRQPLRMAALQFGGMAVLAVLIAHAGRAFGGQGSFADALLVVAWVELLLVAFQVFYLLVMLILPPLGMALGFLAFGLAFYLFLQMIRALHGFRSLFMVLLGSVATFMVVVMVLSIVLNALGLMPEVPQNDL
ncbi:Yip1 family protein [uncultured Paracoccus sp.]|uniref:Yip1 family protein n=1 Tax=uncultured Paracoccus sp. TaxID=189685 RepID=UPI0025F91780|nr:Yip1 family protein [uncultured Paracoccus sp.]